MFEFNVTLVVGHHFDSGSLRSGFKSCIQIRTCRVTDENCDSLVFLEDMELGSAMPQLYRVFSLVATVGATSAGVERSFCLKRLKSYTRNTMGQGCLSSQLSWPLRGHWSSHWKRQLVGMTGSQSIPLKRNREQNLHISKLTNI